LIPEALNYDKLAAILVVFGKQQRGCPEACVQRMNWVYRDNSSLIVSIPTNATMKVQNGRAFTRALDQVLRVDIRRVAERQIFPPEGPSTKFFQSKLKSDVVVGRCSRQNGLPGDSQRIEKTSIRAFSSPGTDPL
jgi:hypothetical protein